MRVLVTGATGFLGTHVLAALTDAGHAPTALLLPGEDAEALGARVAAQGAQAPAVARYAWGDPAGLTPLLEEHAGVVHLAGWMRGDDPARYREVNEGLVRTLLAAPGWTTEHRLVHLSSVAALGPGTPEAPPDEGATPRPVGLYGETKLAGERLVLAADAPARRLVLRAPSLYGPGDASFREAFVQAAAGRYPALGPRDMRFQLAFGPDLARGIAAALARLGDDPAPPALLHLGNPEVLTHEAWAACFAAALGRDVEVLYLGRWGTAAYGWWGALKGALRGEDELVARDKARHLLAGDWVHDFSRQDEVLPGIAWTPHPEATAATLEWYARGEA